MISKFIYLEYGMRLDIAFAVGQISRHNADPRKGHLQVTKRVIRYLKVTMQLRLVFGRKTKNQSHYSLISYADNNFAKDLKDQKSVMGHCFFLNKVVVS